MSFDENLSGTLATIYSGFSQSEHFDSMLREIARFTGGDRAAILLTDPNTESFRGHCSSNLDPEIFDNYNSGWNRRDPIRKFGQNVAINGTLLRQNAVRNETYENTDYFQTINQAGDLKDSVFGAFGAPDAKSRSGISVYRTFKTDYFGAGNAHRLQMLLPHLQNAFLISQNLNAASGPALNARDARPSIRLIVRPDMTFRWDDDCLPMDDKAVRASSVGFLKIGQRQIRAKNQKLQGRLEHLVSRAIETGIGGAMLYPTQDGQHFIVRVAGLAERQRANILHTIDPSVVMLITPPQPRALSPEILDALAEYYQLTPKEMSLIEKLVECGTLKGAALAADITHETARWHIKNILSKTGCSSQVDLLLKLTSF